jgi:hypothetical protein
VDVDDLNAAFFEDVRQPPRCGVYPPITVWKDQEVGSNCTRLSSKLAIVKKDEQYVNALPCEPGDDSQHVAFDASEQLTDRTDRDALGGRAG